MIVGNAESIHDKLDKLPFKFYLTGSQFFLGWGKDTDYFTENFPEVFSALLQLGFQSHSSSRYKDSNCEFVMRKDMVDVQLVKNVDLKIKVQNKLKEKGYTSPTAEIWNVAFDLMS